MRRNWEGIPITTLSRINERGQFHALEVIVVFLGWMLLLAAAWNHTAQITTQQANQFLHEKAFARAQAQSQALIEQHHLNPWNGCTVFDDAKKRTRVHVIAKSCLQQLAHSPATPEIHRVYMGTLTGNETFYQQSTTSTNCAGIERIIRIHETQEVALLGVISCAE
ncbi:MAG: hypothetical protein IPJ89_00065 [Candidatus Iainarchaeum archaeon]|uniref:Uncharacterized protein n=1 Tax=Candidatus Iainarchaeum sp. TaxID=3101447 RepID=A0A7T9DJV0_9ARCH|nr:MAG: hypothetical protein IPJ89_00065 [Candidatus Diapherotrites archaeon]